MIELSLSIFYNERLKMKKFLFFMFSFVALLSAKEHNSTISLDEIVVFGQTPQSENSHSYTTPFMNTATGLELSIKQTPQSVSIISNKFIKDQNLRTIDQAMNYTNGISHNFGDGGGFEG